MNKQITKKGFRKQSGAAFVINFIWKTDPYQRLGKLKNAVRKKYLAKAARQASKRILRRMREFVPIGKTGALKKSLAYRAYVPKSSKDKHVGVGVIGAKRRYVVVTPQIRTSGKHVGEAILHKPSKYFHLVDRGTKRADARPFATMALQQEWPQAKQEMFDILAQEVRNVWP